MVAAVEVRGVLLQALKDAFPGIASIGGPDLDAYFKDIDPAGWYDGEPYLESIRYLRDHISPQVMALMGNQIVEGFKKLMPEISSFGPRLLALNAPEFYKMLMRGPGAGEWRVESYEPGRAVLAENDATMSPSLSLGILRWALEMSGAYNVRGELLNERAAGANVNRYIIEWIHPSGE